MCYPAKAYPIDILHTGFVQKQTSTGIMCWMLLQGEDEVRQSGVPYAIVRPCALTEEPAGADLVISQGDTIKVPLLCISTWLCSSLSHCVTCKHTCGVYALCWSSGLLPSKATVMLAEKRNLLFCFVFLCVCPLLARCKHCMSIAAAPL